MKILFILEYYHPNVGGLEKLFKSLVDTLSAEGHQITILTNGSGIEKPWVERSDNACVYRLPFFNRYLFTILATIPGIFLALRNDLIHTTSYNAGLPAWLAGFLTRTKVVITFHEVWAELWFQLPFFSRPSAWLHHCFEKLLLALPFHAFIAPSEYTKRRLIESGVPPEKTHRIYNGLDYGKIGQQQKRTSPTAPFSFLYFGRLGISKGLDILLAATELLQKGEKEFSLLLILPTQPKSFLQKIRALIIHHNLQQVTNVLHHLDEDTLARQVQSSDCVVIPSYSEGFCFVAAETMSLGTPILSSGRGSLPEVVSGKHITYTEQTAEALSRGMEQAMAGTWEESPLRLFPLADSVSQYVALYQKLSTRP